MDRGAWVEPWQPLKGFSAVPHGYVSDPRMRYCARDGPTNNLTVGKATWDHRLAIRYYLVILKIVVFTGTCQWERASWTHPPQLWSMRLAAICAKGWYSLRSTSSYCKFSVLFHCVVFTNARGGWELEKGRLFNTMMCGFLWFLCLGTYEVSSGLSGLRWYLAWHIFNHCSNN